MRVALLTAEYPPQPGGVGDYTRRLALVLAERGHQVAVITGNADGRMQVVPVEPPDTDAPLDPKPTDRSPVSLWSWRCWSNVIAALDVCRPDILHIQYQTGAYGMQPAINLLPWRLQRLAHRPAVVVTFHDLLEPYLFPKAGPLRRWVTLRLARDADAVIVTNREDAGQLAQLVQRRGARFSPSIPHVPITIPIGSNIPVHPPPGYERARWRAQLGIVPDERLIAYFGLLSRSKGVDVLLDALELLRRDTPMKLPPRLILIGGAATAPQDREYAAEIAAHIARLGLGDRVIQTGQVDAQTVSAHLLAADCVALPFRDGASFRRGSLLAAVTHGTPVVTTYPVTQPAYSQRSPLVDGEHVLLVPAGDSRALATALRRVLDDAELQIQLSRQAHALGAQFQWTDIARQHEEVYTRIAAERSANTRL